MCSNMAASDQELMNYLPFGVLEKSPLTYKGNNIVTTLVSLFLDESSLFLPVTRTIIKASMNVNFGKIASLTLELAVLERLKNQ